jgi:hypothetical protein
MVVDGMYGKHRVTGGTPLVTVLHGPDVPNRQSVQLLLGGGVGANVGVRVVGGRVDGIGAAVGGVVRAGSALSAATEAPQKKCLRELHAASARRGGDVNTVRWLVLTQFCGKRSVTRPSGCPVAKSEALTTEPSSQLYGKLPPTLALVAPSQA